MYFPGGEETLGASFPINFQFSLYFQQRKEQKHEKLLSVVFIDHLSFYEPISTILIFQITEYVTFLRFLLVRKLIHFISMPRGGRSHGRSHHGHHGFGHHGVGHHHFGSSHHHHHRFRGRGIGGISHQASLDLLAANAMPATLMAGIYTFAGNQMKFRTQSVTLPTEGQDIMQQNIMMQQNMMMEQNMMMMQMNNPQSNNAFLGQEMMQVNMMNTVPQPIQQADITIIGSKIKAGDNCCVIATMITGAFCIFPLCFMCCMWWKKMASPMYQLTAEAYRDVAAFIERNPTMNNLNLTVADNSFNAEKARILYENLSRSRITGFTFVNLALACNHNFNQADDFIANVAPIKSLSIATSLTWGDMIA